MYSKEAFWSTRRGKREARRGRSRTLAGGGRGDWVGLWADGGGGGCLGPVWELAALPGLGGVRDLDGPSGEPHLGPGGRVAAPRRGGRAAQWVGAAQVDALLLLGEGTKASNPNPQRG